MVEPGQVFQPSSDDQVDSDAQPAPPSFPTSPPPTNQPPVFNPAPPPPAGGQASPPPLPSGVTPPLPPVEPPAAGPVKPSVGSPPESAPADNTNADLNTSPAQDQAADTPSTQDTTSAPASGEGTKEGFATGPTTDQAQGNQPPPIPSPPPPPTPPTPTPSQDLNPEPTTDPDQPENPLPPGPVAPPTPPAPPTGQAGEQAGGNPQPPPLGPTAAPPADGNQAVADRQPSLISWQASEYIQHHHSPLWYVGLFVIAAGLAATMGLVLREWLSAAVIVLMAVALLVYSHRHPRVLDYSISNAGINISDKFFPYSQFHAFAVVPSQNLLTIELDPVKRFMPRISMFLDKAEANKVDGVLQQHLPREDRKADFIDRLSHALKF